MKAIQAIYLTFAIVLLPFIEIAAIQDQQALKEKMISDLNIIKNTFDVKYAPADWKRTFSGWDLDHEIDTAKAQILSVDNITVKDYQRILKDFFKSTKDYHVGVHFYSTSSAFLPFRILSANGKYFVTWVDIHSNSKLAVGDEIISFDGRPIHDVVTDLKKLELGNPDSKTDQAFAEMFLTARIGEIGHDIPNGSVSIVAKSEGKTSTHKLQWDHTPDGVIHDALHKPKITAAKVPLHKASIKSQSKAKAQKPSLELLTEHPYFHKQMSVALYEPLHAAFEQQYRSSDKEQEREAEILGSRKSFIPRLGQVIWEAPAEYSLYAYLYKTKDQKTIGYIRIPEYMGGTPCAEEFADLVTLFQRRSEALVIDQVNNPGGELFYMYALVSMLNPTSLQLPTQRLTITQQDVFNALEILASFEELKESAAGLVGAQASVGETISGYPLDEQLVESMINHFSFIISEWNEGRSFTNPAYVYGIETLTTHPKACYTKPILVLVNSLDFSCADFLPAILQDNKRATIFGTKTAGAGGILLSQSHPNRFGISNYTFTGSIAERPDKNPIENLGVTPDITYELTEKDLQGNYAGYVGAVNQAIDTLLKQKKPKNK